MYFPRERKIEGAMRTPSQYPCISAQLELVISCFSCSLSCSLPTLSSLCLIYLRPVLWV